MIPTKRFWLLVALGIPLAMLAGAAGSMWVVYAYNCLLLIVGYVTLRLGPDPKSITVRRRFDPVLSVRVPNKIELRVTNDGVEPVAMRMRDESPPSFASTLREFSVGLQPGEERSYNYQITPPERGSDYFRGTYLRMSCPLGLVQRQAKVMNEEPVRVYPNVLALREFDLLRQKGKLREIGIRISRIRGLGSDFESLRDYGEGDDYRKIDWKASARRDKLIVRQFEQERNQPVVLCIDVGRKMLSEVNGVTKLDLVLDSLLMLTHAASVAGDFVGLLVYSDRVKRYIPPRKGRNQVGFIIEAIHDLVAEPVESDAAAAFAYLATRWKRRSLVVAFADAEDGEDAKNLSAAFGSVARRNVALLARIGDPRLNELVNADTTDLDAFYRRAVAMQLVNERKQAGSVLSAVGIHNLEAEPQDLAAALVSFYFMVKEKSMI